MIKSALTINSLSFVGNGFLLPDSSGSPSSALKNSMPMTLFSLTTIFLGIASVSISTFSSLAASISSVSAGISFIPRRYANVTFFAPRRIADLAASKAVDPPPTTTTFPLISFGLLVLISLRNNNASMTPSAFSPSSPREKDLGAPPAIKTAEKPFLNKVAGSLILTSVLISMPNPFIQSISRFNILFGRRYDGIPYLSMPPVSFFSSKTVTGYPTFIKSTAAVKPAGPAPIIAICSS